MTSHYRRYRCFGNARCIFVVHNMGYHGVYPNPPRWEVPKFSFLDMGLSCVARCPGCRLRGRGRVVLCCWAGLESQKLTAWSALSVSSSCGARSLSRSLSRSLALSLSRSLALSLSRSLALSLSRSLSCSCSRSLSLALARSLARSLQGQLILRQVRVDVPDPRAPLAGPRPPRRRRGHQAPP
eukprot:3339660-Rhodomonas_salina.1